MMGKSKDKNNLYINKQFKNENGITLMVLIVSVIILLILSTVVITNIAGQDTSMVKTVEEQKDKMLEAEAKQYVEVAIEKVKLQNASNKQEFIEKLKEELQKDDVDSQVSINKEEDDIYIVNFKGYKFNYNYRTEQNITRTGGKPTYYNPVIPVGFKILETEDASWDVVEDETLGKVVKGWNDGLVIQDKSGNEFVWVPVDGVNVKYEKWCTKGIAYNNGSISDDKLPNGVASGEEYKKEDEENQIKIYGGFYIARYEAGIPSYMTEALTKTNKRNENGIPVSKKNQIPWNSIDYDTAKNNSESMYYDSEFVQSGLVTGRMWDTVMKWLKNSEVDVQNDSREWGNYYNSTVTGVTWYSPFNSSNTGATWEDKRNLPVTKETASSPTDYDNIWLLRTGNSEYTKRKNIYDLAGNLYEWTNEIYSSNFVNRGGNFFNDALSAPAAGRHSSDSSGAYYSVRLPCSTIYFIKIKINTI